MSTEIQAGHYNWKLAEQYARSFTRQALVSYVLLCFGMGLLAGLLPVVLPLLARTFPNYSISHFYYAGVHAQSVFGGVLWAEGVFLLLNQGLSWKENATLAVAGLAAISVAMNPMLDLQCPKHEGFGIHEASAMVLFFCMALVAIKFSRDRLDYIVSTKIRCVYSALYLATGIAMLAMPTFIILAHLVTTSACWNWVYWVETFGIEAFATYWLIKTREYQMLLRLHSLRVDTHLFATAPDPTVPPPKVTSRDTRDAYAHLFEGVRIEP